MPEYLAPGVYIEEVEIGAKPIEGVSTSTGGFLGYAERGPLNTPALVTSFAQFQSVFGGFLPAEKDGTDLSQIRWLAYAVSAFFENGGKRVYVTRVASGSAAAALGYLPGITGSATRDVLNGSARAKEQALQLKDAGTFTAGDLILLEDGNRSEYLTFKDNALEFRLKGSATMTGDHLAGANLDYYPIAASTTLSMDAVESSNAIEVTDSTGISSGVKLFLEALAAGENEVVEVKSSYTLGTAIPLTSSLQYNHSSAETTIHVLGAGETSFLVRNAVTGDENIYADNSTIATTTDDCCIQLNSECQMIKRIIEAAGIFQVAPPLKHDHNAGSNVTLVEETPALAVTASSTGTWGNSLKVSVIPSSISSTQLIAAVSSPTDRLDLETITGIEAGSILKLTSSTDTYLAAVLETHKTDTDTYIVLENTFTGTLEIGDSVETQEFDLYVSDGSNEELFKNLSLNSQHSRFFGEIITEKSSNLIYVNAYTGSGDTIDRPTTDNGTGWFLGGGNDGFPADEMEMNTIYAGVDNTEPVSRTGLHTFKNIDEINIAAIPGVTTKYLQQKLVNHCEVAMRDRFAVLDSMALAGLDEVKAQRNLFDSSYAALYYPWLYAFDPLSKGYINMPPSGFVSGIYARADVERGVHKAPANEKVNGVVNTERLNGKYRIVDKGTQDILNPLGVNCIRSFPGRGIRVWGARTMSSNSLWKYVNVRRLFLFLEESIEKGTQWVVFEPNDPKLWARVKQTISQFLTSVWKSGALMGNTPDDAFFIKCDDTTMTQSDIDNGRLVVQVGVAPVKPAEFVIFRIAQWQGGSAATE